MSFTIDRHFPAASLAEIEPRTRAALAARGFGILTEIDLAATMKAKLGETIPGYRILGACNPKFALGAIRLEPRVGTMLPCNVILREVEGGVAVSAVDPVASMQAIDNTELTDVAAQVRGLLAEAVAAI